MHVSPLLSSATQPDDPVDHHNDGDCRRDDRDARAARDPHKPAATRGATKQPRRGHGKQSGHDRSPDVRPQRVRKSASHGIGKRGGRSTTGTRQPKKHLERARRQAQLLVRPVPPSIRLQKRGQNQWAQKQHAQQHRPAPLSTRKPLLKRCFLVRHAIRLNKGRRIAKSPDTGKSDSKPNGPHRTCRRPIPVDLAPRIADRNPRQPRLRGAQYTEARVSEP